MDAHQLAKVAKASVSQISSWETGDSRPSFSKAIQVAKALRIPFGYLFLSTPPPETIQIPDFRTVGDREQHHLSIDFRDTLQNALVKQQWFKERKREVGETGFNLVFGDIVGIDREQTAHLMRESMGWSDETRRSCGTAGQYLTQLVSKAEALGILVMRSGVVGSNNKRKLSVSEFRGFALADDFAPVIFINSNDARTAQVFTFAHELVHVWMGQSGVSDPETVAATGDAPTLEVRCNELAASLVAPKEEMEEIWHTKRNPEYVATHFRVSEVVVLRRAVDLGLISPDEFTARVRVVPQRIAKRGQGGNFNTTLPARNSPLFTRTLLADVRRGTTAYRDAARLLAVKPGTIRKLTSPREAR
jgi:Zn-dependent peptidase ImmA (M78 family)/DNA-binding XRE family transcriptional regulator